MQKKKISPEEAAAMEAAKLAEELENTPDGNEDESESDVKAEAGKTEDGNGKDTAGSKKSDKPEEEKDPAAELKDKLVRQMAEFDNYRKRTEKEKSAMYDMGAKAIIEKILPTIDNFERGLQNAPDDAFAEGMKMVYKEMLKNLENAGLKAIDCVDKEFDPNIHNAVMHDEDDSDRVNIVTEELQKGYTYKESLVRPSMVKVVN